MKTAKVLGSATIASLLLAATAFAQDAAAPVAEAVAEVVPVIDKGDTAWMMVSTMLVILMVLPGLALFYGGLVRSKNMLSVLMQVMVTFSMIVVLWVLFGAAVLLVRRIRVEDASLLVVSGSLVLALAAMAGPPTTSTNSAVMGM